MDGKKKLYYGSDYVSSKYKCLHGHFLFTQFISAIFMIQTFQNVSKNVVSIISHLYD